MLRASSCPKAGSWSMKIDAEVTHHSKYRHLGVLNSHGKRQIWACSTSHFAFSVNSETKNPSQNTVHLHTRKTKKHVTQLASSLPDQKKTSWRLPMCVSLVSTFIIIYYIAFEDIHSSDRESLSVLTKMF